MKVLQIYCLYDKVTREGSSLFTANNHDHALRIKEEAGKNDQYAEDKELYYLGDYLIEGHQITNITDGENSKITPSIQHVKDAKNASI